MTEDNTEMVRVSHMVPKRDRETAQDATEYGELSERVRQAYKVAAYGESAGRESELQAELEQIRSKKDRLRSKINEIQAELENVERRESRVEERLEEVRGREERYEGHLESLEAQIRDGMAVFEEHGAIQRAAEEGGTTPSGVITKLQQRNPDLPDRAFKRQTKVDQKWRGVDADDDLRVGGRP